MRIASTWGDDGIDLMIRAFCRAAKDSIQISSPTFGMYASFAQIQDAAVVDVPLINSDSGYSLDTCLLYTSDAADE